MRTMIVDTAGSVAPVTVKPASTLPAATDVALVVTLRDAPTVEFTAGDIEIGAVELKDGTTDTRGVVGAGTGITEAGNAVAVKDPVLGVSTGAAVITDADGKIQQYLRGLVKLWIAGLSAGAAIIGKVGIDQTTPGTTNKVSVGSDVVHVIADSGTITAVTAITNALPAGTNAIGKLAANSGVDIGDVDVTSLPALPAGSNTIGAVTNTALTDVGAGEWETVAASQTTQVIGPTGAAGDYLSHVVVFPTSTTPGVVTILDNATTWGSFPGGAGSITSLAPFAIPVGAKSSSGAWKITTGANLSCVAVGNFT